MMSVHVNEVYNRQARKDRHVAKDRSDLAPECVAQECGRGTPGPANATRIDDDFPHEGGVYLKSPPA